MAGVKRGLVKWACALALASCFVASTAAAAIRVRYSAAAGCPSKSDFEREVRARTALASFDDTATRVFDVSVSQSGASFVGRLRASSPSGRATERVVDGETCADVVAALALAGALAIDPNASLAPVASVQPEPPAPPPPMPEPSTPPPRAPDVARPYRIVPHDVLPVSAVAWRFAVGASADMLTAIAPSPLVGGALYAEVARSPAGLWSPALRVSAAFASSGALDGASPAARFTMTAARVDLCPIRFALGELSLCSE